MDVIDNDLGMTPDELVDFFLIFLTSADLVPGASSTIPQIYSGTFGVATIELSFQLECLPGFFGEECTMTCDSFPCDNGGVCSPDATNGFTCTCVGDFTGRSCDMTIDDCLNVNCNNGTCVDGVGTFTCECEAGYTGQLCDQTVQAVAATVAGALVGGILIILLCVIAIVILVLLLILTKRGSRPANEGNRVSH